LQADSPVPRTLPDPALPLADLRKERSLSCARAGRRAHGEVGWEPDKGNAKRVEQRPGLDTFASGGLGSGHLATRKLMKEVPSRGNQFRWAERSPLGR